MMRTDRAGDLRSTDIDREVVVCGWVDSRRDHGGVVFLDVRDVAGLVQVVVDPEQAGGADVHRVRNEYVVRIEGTVRHRPEGTVNDTLPTGEVEIAATVLEVLNESDTPPFPVDDRIDADEMLRLRHRYVDLRRPRLQRNLRVRATVNAAVRRSLDAQGFTEVETPMLIASTPEGARDFVVPSRLSPGEFYALPQSPQLFKQLLMVGGLDRYYQIARCLRDEDLRADRQFEFMQLDAEMSFADADDVMDVISQAVLDASEAVTGTRPGPVSRMTWHQAQEHYGSDKPDVRFGLELVDLCEVYAATEFRAFQADVVKGIRLPGEGGMSRAQVDKLVDRAKQLGAGGLVWMRVVDGAKLECPVLKYLTEAEQLGIVDTMGAAAGDLLLVAAGTRRQVDHVLGTLRVELGRPPVHEGGLEFLWVVDFPLFEALDDDGNPDPRAPPVHHAAPRRHGAARARQGRGPPRGAVTGLRPRAQRLGARLGQRPDPPSRHPAADLLAARHLGRRGAVALRLPARRVPLRRAAARRVRVRDRPPHRDPGGGGQHPRGDRVPEDAVRGGSAHGRADCDRPGPAPGARPVGAAQAEEIGRQK